MASNMTMLDEESPQKAATEPARTLLRNWGRRMSKGGVPMIPVFVGGAWSVQVPRGNKRILRLNVDKKAFN